MNYFFCAIMVLWLTTRSLCQQCPASYLRYSKDHSYCKPINSTCPISHSGVTPSEINQILDLHNKYRSLIATGKETQAGGLPEASDMLQMVWDEELAAVAQRTAEQCIYKHDCSNCRRVENFSVGQNIAFLQNYCFGECHESSIQHWDSIIKMFYDEVAVFDKKFVTSMTFIPGKIYGHFTQIIWAKTWRVGCGFVAYRIGYGYRQLYFCNYGPSGNNAYVPVYKAGPPCSACPINSCCGSSCNSPSYAGLCRMNNNNESPLYQPEEGNYIFYCDFRKADGDCETSIEGANKWKYVQTLGGSYAEVVLSGGETSTMKFKNLITPKQSFCLILKYRSGSAIDGQKSSSAAILKLEMANFPRPITMNLPRRSSKEFFEFKITLNWNFDMKASFTFSVPEGLPEQYFDVQLLAAMIGACP